MLLGFIGANFLTYPPQEPDNRSSGLVAGPCHSVLEFRQIQPIGVGKPAEISERTARSFALLAFDLC